MFMNNNQKKILEMLAAGKISVAEAERLLSLTQPDNLEGDSKETKKIPKYLRVLITPLSDSAEPGHSENVNIRVPMALLRAGIKLASIIPPSAYDDVDSALKGKGLQMDLRDIKPENIEELIAALSDMEINIEDANNRVRVYAE
jgi:hypothetical protein